MVYEPSHYLGGTTLICTTPPAVALQPGASPWPTVPTARLHRYVRDAGSMVEDRMFITSYHGLKRVVTGW